MKYAALPPPEASFSFITIDISIMKIQGSSEISPLTDRVVLT
jgi:hypothetical protein